MPVEVEAEARSVSLEIIEKTQQYCRRQDE